MLQPPGFYYVKKPKRFVILSSDKSSERNLSCFFDIIKPRRMEHLQSEEPFSSDPYFNTFCFTFQVRFTGYRDRPLHERQTKFICALREGHTEIVSIFLSNFTFKKYRYRIIMNIEQFTYFHGEHLFLI